MTVREIYNLADTIAPFCLSKEYMQRYGAYDNSGILLDCGETIKGILFCLDLSLEAVSEAKRLKANLIFTHHPAIYAPLHSLGSEEGDKVLLCAREGISVLSAHLNLDAAPGGIDESLMHALGGEEALAVMETLTGGGYGRVFEVNPSSLSQFVQRAKETLRTKQVFRYGEREVKRAAVFCGGGLTEQALKFAIQNAADTIVSSDGKHHLIAEALEKGLNLLLLTHYASELYGFQRFYEKMKERSVVPCSFFLDERLL